jgi:hypothetical protein
MGRCGGAGPETCSPGAYHSGGKNGEMDAYSHRRVGEDALDTRRLSADRGHEPILPTFEFPSRAYRLGISSGRYEATSLRVAETLPCYMKRLSHFARGRSSSADAGAFSPNAACRTSRRLCMGYLGKSRHIGRPRARPVNRILPPRIPPIDSLRAAGGHGPPYLDSATLAGSPRRKIRGEWF